MNPAFRRRWWCVVGALLAAMSGVPHAEGGEVVARAIAFESAGLRLAGTLTVPAGREARAGVLIIPGSGPLDRDGASRAAPGRPPVYRQWAERLGEVGFAVLRYDKRVLTHPGIDVTALDQEAQIEDARSAVVFLRSAPGLASRPIFLVGHSEGGTLAPIVAERAGPIAGVVVVNAALFPIDELLVEQLRANPAVGPTVVAETERLLARIKDGSFPRGGVLLGAGGAYWAQWIRYSTNASTTLSSLTVPLLLVQCSRDETLPGRTLDRNLAIARAVSNAQLRELADHDHFAMRPGERTPSAEFLTAVAGWLGDRLAPR